MSPRRNVTSVHRSSPDVICSSGKLGHTNGFVDRGIFRSEYTGTTLRDHYGLARPANPHTVARLATADVTG